MNNHESEQNRTYDGITARVTAVHRGRFNLVCENGELSAVLKTNAYRNNEAFPTVGDYVTIDYNPLGESRILKTLERKSFFERLDPSTGCGQAVAANFDYVFIVQSLNANFNIRRMERYLTLAWQSGGVPVVVLTKADEAKDMSDMLSAAAETAAGVEVIAVSSKTGQGMDGLKKYIAPGKTLVLLGSSGVGKSTLINAFMGREIMEVGEIREDDARGRHTTTHRQLITLDNGAMIIDTPGMRELGMWNAADGLEHSFRDIEELTAQCRFSDCSHTGEAGCAVSTALKEGTLSRERWENWCNIKKEAMYADDKKNYMNQKKQRFKEIALKNKHNSRNLDD